MVQSRVKPGAAAYDQRMATFLSVRLNARLRPLDRGERYEDPLQGVLDARAPGSQVTGGGTMLGRDGEPAWSDIDVDLQGDPDRGLALVIDTLQGFGAPKGSTARLAGGSAVPFGSTEGLGVYLNGTDLPGEVYASSDVNELIGQLLDRLGDQGAMQSYWQGQRETALYLYGPSADRMRGLIREVLDAHPLAERSRLVDLA
jgi:hypothetical protein